MLRSTLLVLLVFLYLWGLILLQVPLMSAMANKVKPTYLKNQELLIKKDMLVSCAVEEYRAQTATPGSREWYGYRAITNKVMDDYQRETCTNSNPRGEHVQINWTTV